MSRRRITISCPGCRDEFKDITVDEAEGILFNGCLTCRNDRGGATVVDIDADAAESAARELEGSAE